MDGRKFIMIEISFSKNECSCAAVTASFNMVLSFNMVQKILYKIWCLYSKTNPVIVILDFFSNGRSIYISTQYYCMFTRICNRERPISYFETDVYRYFPKFFHRYLVNCPYSIGHWYRYSKICWFIFQYFNKVIWLKLCGLFTAPTYGCLTNEAD